MMLSENNSALFTSPLSNSIILRKNIRVKSSKLPSDFFGSLQMSRYSPKKTPIKRSIAEEYTRQTYTPSFERHENLNINLPSHLLPSHRKIGTARVTLNRDDTLINDVISTTKNIKRVLRKKSLEIVSHSHQRQEIELCLPKIKNHRRESHNF